MTPAEALARSDVLHDRAAVAAAYDRLAADIERALGARDPLLLCVMVGGLMPAAELARRFGFPFQLDYLHATRYRGDTRGAALEWRARPSLPLAGRCVLLVDDILDEGVTLRAVAADCRARGAAEVRIAVLVKKDHARRVAGVEADFVGLRVPDRYVFGCGMDYREYHRNLPEIRALREE
jgi:hypoxanthine phosphoribosyltransferase